MPADTLTRFFESKERFALRDGSSLPGITIAYETWGELNADASNAVLLFHALSGSHHAAGSNPGIPGTGDLWQPELHEGWWEEMIGPGKAIDTDELFVICPNYLGGCYGSTGPASVNPETGKRWGSSFPSISAADQVNATALLLDSLGIGTLHALVGPSVGGLIALTFATRLPDRVRNVINIAAGFKTTVLNRLILFEQILAIENDPNFNGGDYYETKPPFYGLALARMISHKTFVHLDSFENRARQKIRAALRCEHLPPHHRSLVELRCIGRGRRGDSGGAFRGGETCRAEVADFFHRLRFLFLSRGASGACPQSRVRRRGCDAHHGAFRQGA
jgi:homoserine O-acetyltransferase